MGPVSRTTRRASRLATIYANTRVAYFQKWLRTFDKGRMHIPNKFTVIRIFLVFNRCRIRSDTRRAYRWLSTVVIAVLCSAASILERGDIRSDLVPRQQQYSAVGTAVL